MSKFAIEDCPDREFALIMPKGCLLEVKQQLPQYIIIYTIWKDLVYKCHKT